VTDRTPADAVAAEAEFADVLQALRAAEPVPAPAALRERAVAAVRADRAPDAPWGAFAEHADAVYAYLSTLLEGDSWLAEHTLTEGFARATAAAKGAQPTLAELVQAARHAALEALAKEPLPASPNRVLDPVDHALLLERRLGLSLVDLARGWSQMPARLTERLAANAEALLAQLEEGADRASPCADGRAALVAAPLDLLEAEAAEDHAKHLESCPACAGWTAPLEDAMTAAPRTLPAPEKTKQRLEERLAPADVASAAELGIRVAVSCCYCHDRLQRDQAAFCAACLAPHHPDCFQAHGRCATPGCAGVDMVRPTGGAAPGRTFGRQFWSTLGGLLLGATAAAAGAAWGFGSEGVAEAPPAAGSLAAAEDPGQRWRGPQTYDEQLKKTMHLTPRADAPRAPRAKPKLGAHQPLTLLEDEVTITVQKGDYPLPYVLENWTKAKGWALDVDPQVAQIKLSFSEERVIDREQLHSLLGARDVVLVVGPGASVQAVHRRNAAARGFASTLIEGDQAVDPDAFVTRVMPIQHGNGASIFATLRGILTRDPTRVANILYNESPEQITISDFARNVRHYEQIAARLDQPRGPGVRAQVELFRLSAAGWETLRKEKRSAYLSVLRSKLRDRGKLVESVDLDVEILRGQPGQIFKRALDGGASVELSAAGSRDQVHLVLGVAGAEGYSKQVRCAVGSSVTVQSLRLPPPTGTRTRAAQDGEILVLVVSGREGE
jgi:hypothetical protein